MCEMGKGFNTAADVPLLKHLIDLTEPLNVQPPAELSTPLLKGLQRREDNHVIQLPLWHELERGTPNSFLRSALFSAIQSKDRQYLKEVTLASSKDVSLKFTGEQLNQEDLTVWEALVHLARTSPLGNVCNFTAHGLLKSLELHTGGAEHRRLHSTIIRLAGAVVEIKHEGKQYFGTLIQSGVKDELTKHYAIRLSPELIRLYGETQWTALNWNQRLQLRSKSLAQALHGYYSSHSRPYPVKLVTLQLYTGSQNSDSRSFKRQVNRALKELLEIGFLDNYHLDRNLVTVWRKS
jgi:hypothetical protein